MASLTTAVQAFSITISLMTAGSVATLSIFDLQELKSQPAERSLPMLRWLFSRGSHIYPPAAFLSSAGFAYLAYDAIPSHLRSITRVLQATNSLKFNGYLAASILAFSMAPVTQYVMLRNNFELIEKNEEKGGARSAKSAQVMHKQGSGIGLRSAEESVESKGDINEFKDLSGPQSETAKSFTEAERKEVQEKLTKFSRQNLLRAMVIGAGGMVGLLNALT
nr:hypothetical protein CFP56_70550 [Quercus suber]